MPHARPLILIVEDDPAIRRALAVNLEADGYDVLPVRTGTEALAGLARRLPDLAVIDLGLPDMHGFSLCQKIHAVVPLPVIILTAIDQEATVVRGLTEHAEDYVVKPYRYAELEARIQRVLRRTRGDVVALARSADGRVAINLARRELQIAGQALSLTPIECRILGELLHAHGQSVSSERLVDVVWPDGDGDADRLRVHIRALRRKLEPSDMGPPRYLRSQRGRGYSLCDFSQEEA